MKRIKFFAILGILALGAQPIRAHAMDRDVRTVITTGAYGMLAGTGLGLIAFPLAQDARAIFIGTSVGLYLGIAIGIYHITHRDDPGNPLTYEKLPERQVASRPLNRFNDLPPPILDFRVPIFRF